MTIIDMPHEEDKSLSVSTDIEKQIEPDIKDVV